jgi:hypothetical protein
VTGISNFGRVWIDSYQQPIAGFGLRVQKREKQPVSTSNVQNCTGLRDDIYERAERTGEIANNRTDTVD